MAKDPIKKLIAKHEKLVHSENMKVDSHVQREKDDWFINTIMLDGITIPFKYNRKKRYKSLNGQRVNVTYYPETEVIAGMEIEIMKVVRIKVS